jgi:phenylpropionate dioxygenase-like ring-hydroxylating dioxygenase large terminal subunit
VSDEQTRIRHLEQRIFAQKRTITSLQATRRERNVRARGWYQGREALLQEQLAAARREADYWRKKAEAD